MIRVELTVVSMQSAGSEAGGVGDVPIMNGLIWPKQRATPVDDLFPVSAILPERVFMPANAVFRPFETHPFELIADG
jgi:hypothetical protein